MESKPKFTKIRNATEQGMIQSNEKSSNMEDKEGNKMGNKFENEMRITNGNNRQQLCE